MRIIREILLITVLLFAEGIANDCVPYRVDNHVVACVCNATYCDSIPDDVPRGKSIYWYVSNKEGLRMHQSETKFDSSQSSEAGTILTVNTMKKYQRIFGFGGAFTDSAGINIKKLSPATQDQLLRAYYDPKVGSGYNLGRIPIAGSDFSTRAYTYDDVANDTSLKHFALTQEDYDYKLPYIKEAVKMNPKTKLFSASWTAPPWMKTNEKFDGRGYLKREYYQLFADYIVKFLDEYKKNGVDIWAVSTGNEPLVAILFNLPLTSMAWTPDSMANWVVNYLCPTLESSPYSKTQILTLDDNRNLLPSFIEPLLSQNNCSKNLAGIAVHWYQDGHVLPSILDEMHDKFPNKFILMTEASERPAIWDTPNLVSESWIRGEDYILSIIEYMNHWSIGWVDWNLALDKFGGPNFVHNYIDAPIIVNPETDEFYKQPMYYAIHHFSKFVERGSIRINITDTDTIKSSAFLTPSDEVVVVLYNKAISTQQVTLKDTKKGTFSLQLAPKSMNTLRYKV